LGVEGVQRGRYRKLETAYINPYEISRIVGKNLVFIPNLEVGGKVLVSDESSRPGRSRNLEAA
jgi:hypothetical protein